MQLPRHLFAYALVFAGLAILPAAARSQGFEGTECKLPGNPGLREQLTKGTVDQLRTYTGRYALWATSFLAPSGKAPAKPKSEDDDAQEAYAMALVAWSCQYDPGKAQDGKPETAWVEGVPGHGVGEVLIVQVNTRIPVEIWAGFGKSPALHAANSRPRKVRVLVLQSLVTPNPDQVGESYRDIAVLASGEAELRDFNGYQALAVPAHTLRQAKGFSDGKPWPMDDTQYERMTFVAIEILSVYEGTKYQDTAISEVRNVPAPSKR